ncbi:hypothetical protein GGS20DRAFT_83956 [Poronia punctata]|nr:hypothetical protein GGS20DRAFT_83956 [Poronia punctata]
MSGRSAYVRKKITEPKSVGKSTPTPGGGRSKSSGNSWMYSDDGSLYDYPMPPGTGYGTTNARFLKFSEPTSDGDPSHFRLELASPRTNSSGSQSGGSENYRRESSLPNQGPMPDYAYARARKPILKTEDVSGVERSGFRSAVDKTSDDIRKGLTKAFTLGLKKKKEGQISDRTPSSATIRHHEYDHGDYDSSEVPSMPLHPPPTAAWEPNYLQATSPPPAAKLPPIPPSTTPPIKRWIGGGRPVQRWNKLRKDPELWDPNGDVLVFFGRKDQPQRPNPSFRLSSHIIEATESRFLIALLREGSTEDDYVHMYLPPSPMGAPPMLRHNSYAQMDHAGQSTPPISEDNANADLDGQISYEMYFPTPSNLNKVETHRHAITTRNVFALLYHASLVGLSLYQALSDLLDRLDTYMEPDSDNVGMMLNYISVRGIDDARNDAETAVSMLAWSESPEVRWEEGWREAFAHCAGMYPRIEGCADFRHLTPITRALLERACLEMQLRVRTAEERLAEFAYADMWPTTGPVAHGAAKAAAERLQQFLIGYYAKMCGTWPPAERGVGTMEGEEMWLTRRVAHMLQRDFGALYEYLVNRDIVWDESETRSSRKWMMVSESGNRSFNADSDDLPLTDMLIEFDNRMRFPHIPHPYPLVPESIRPATSLAASSSRDKHKKEKSAKSMPDDRMLDRRVQLAYTEATNIYILESEFTQSDLIDDFSKFEKSDHIGAVHPFSARRGRWVLIYGILQTLASVSVDSPNVRYKDNVSYHLSPRLKGTRTPPWRGVSSPTYEACHELSHCWLAPRSWHSTVDKVELNTSVKSSRADPVMRMMRDQAKHDFPHPPPTPGAYSVRSDGATTPTMWGGSSARSVSNYSDDTMASGGGQAVSSAHFPGYKGLRRPGAHGRGGGGTDGIRNERNATMLSPRGQFYSKSGDIADPNTDSFSKARIHGNATQNVNDEKVRRRPAPLDLSRGGKATRTGHFLDTGAYTPTGGAGDKSPRSPRGSEVLTPLIRDFDELDSVVEESAYENIM